MHDSISHAIPTLARSEVLPLELDDLRRRSELARQLVQQTLTVSAGLQERAEQTRERAHRALARASRRRSANRLALAPLLGSSVGPVPVAASVASHRAAARQDLFQEAA